MLTSRHPGFRTGELGLAVLIVVILSLMIVPLPPLLIDVFLALNLSLSVVVLMAAIYSDSPMALSTFPSLLLLTTMFRLSLNIASTKAILLHAEAGHIIDSFGRLVVGGNLIVGLVVFCIIAAVQFIVIAKGSERASEVGARFALDAMPGHQMSIDAELRGGTLSPEEAQSRRIALSVESRLFGGMDGAMKFVKGDAIASLVITAINLVGGISIGVLFHQMDLATATERFSVLAIGDAMVSQLPSLLISVAAGVLTTRVADRSSNGSVLGNEILSQLSGNRRAVGLSAVLVGLCALLPGFPSLIFMGVAVALGWAALGSLKSGGTPSHHTSLGAAVPSFRGYIRARDTPIIERSPPAFTAPVSVRISPDLLQRLDIKRWNEALEAQRTSMELSLGVPFPGGSIWIAENVLPAGYEVWIHDVPQTVPMLSGRGSIEAELSEAIFAVVRSSLHRLMGVQESQHLLELLVVTHPGLVAEVQKVLPPLRLADVLRRLLEEAIPVRDMRGICESLAYWAPKEKDPVLLAEHVRATLGAWIAHRAAQGEPVLLAVSLDVSMEQAMRQAIKPTPSGNYLALEEEMAEEIGQRIRASMCASGASLPLVVSMDIRRYVHRFLVERWKDSTVYSFQELSGHVKLNLVAQASLEQVVE